MDATIDELVKMSNIASKQMNLQMQIMDKTFKEAIQKLPKEKADEVERLKIKTQTAINLARQGKTIEANDILKDLGNGGKSN